MSKKEERRGLFFSACRAVPEGEAYKPPYFTKEEKLEKEGKPQEEKPTPRMIAFGGSKSRFQVEVEARRKKQVERESSESEKE